MPRSVAKSPRGARIRAGKIEERRMRAWVVLCVWAAAGAAALAQAGAAMKASELKRELFGFEMAGVHQSSGEPFTECIDPSGKTLFRFNGETDEGRLRVTPESEACFAYASSQFQYEACWYVKRAAGGQYRFESTATSDVYVTKRTRRVRACNGSAQVS
jgi:hypothetical protein